MKFGILCCVYDEPDFLELSIFALANQVDKILFLVNDRPWCGEWYDNSKTIELIRNFQIHNIHVQLVQKHWEKEIDLRNDGLNILSSQGIDYAFILDSDELIEIYQFQNLRQFIEANSHVTAFHIMMNTYWKDFYKIYPRENYAPLIAVKTNHYHFDYIRQGKTNVIKSGSNVIEVDEPQSFVIVPEQIAALFHLSYARSDEFVRKKMLSASHNPEFIEDWFNKIWMQWNPDMRNLHPMKPTQYLQAVKEDFSKLPARLKGYIKKKKLKERTCSIIILNWNSCDLLKRCLDLIEKNTTRKYEIIIVDNGSKDGSVDLIQKLDDSVKKIFNRTNLGFPAGVNQAMRLCKDSDICLLNVDAEVQDKWLENMYETMIRIEDAGMVGPLGNNVPSRHQSLRYVEVDTRVPNLYGYCLLILRELIDKIGYFDEIYSPGQYEDNDYGIRAKLAGYELYISALSTVLHEPHQVFEKNKLNYQELDQKNREIYLNKFYGILLDYSKTFDYYAIPQLASSKRLTIF